MSTKGRPASEVVGNTGFKGDLAGGEVFMTGGHVFGGGGLEAGAFGEGSVGGVVVKGEGGAGEALGEGMRIGVAVEGFVVGVEDHQPVEEGGDGHHGSGGLAGGRTGEKKPSIPLLLVTRVEVIEHIQAAVQSEASVVVEVGVHL